MLDIQNLSKSFHQGTINQKDVLKDLSLTLNDGDFVTVIGGNGAGKSTLLNLIAGTYSPDQGNISINAHAIEKLSEPKRAPYISRVFQDPMLGTCADMTIEENLAMAYRRGKRRTLAWGISHQERQFFKSQLASLELGLENRLTTKAGLLSGGQRQALSLLMATMVQLPYPEYTVKENLLHALDMRYSRLKRKQVLKALPISSQLRACYTQKTTDLSKETATELKEIMIQLTKPYLLLLDEHTAALDPKTSQKVLQLTQKMITEHHLSAIMVTHNMKDALNYGNRLWVMAEGKIVLDIPEAQKKNLQVKDLLALFGNQVDWSDQMLLSH